MTQLSYMYEHCKYKYSIYIYAQIEYMNLVCVCVFWKYHHLSPTSWNISKPSSNEENNSYIDILISTDIIYTYIAIYYI